MTALAAPSRNSCPRPRPIGRGAVLVASALALLASGCKAKPRQDAACAQDSDCPQGVCLASTHRCGPSPTTVSSSEKHIHIALPRGGGPGAGK